MTKLITVWYPRNGKVRRSVAVPRWECELSGAEEETWRRKA